jgi:hypothetical protein
LTVTTPVPSRNQQFLALLELHSAARWQDLVEGSSTLVAMAGLKPAQKALILGLRMDALKALGQQDTAADDGLQALSLWTSPLTALQWLEGQLQHLVFEQGENEASQSRGWVAICQLLIRKGYAAPLLRTVMAVLAQLPLEGHREQLLNLLEERDALLLADSEEMARAWRWLRQAAPSGGNGFWA